jgi:hypothetical protein
MTDTSAVRSRIVVVPGMHRAGTSVVARALQTLGLDLGDALMSADARMNARGFFEDTDVVRLDDALLDALGADWKSTALLADTDWDGPALAQARSEARVLLERKLARTGSFACKDPRIPRLLPLWQRVFGALGVDDAYVIAVRHPLAVIASLTARDGLDPRRSAWLWVEHLLCALRYTQGRVRVVVDYDRLLANPGRELARMAQALHLPAPHDDALRGYVGGFLTGELRHAVFAADDLTGVRDHPLVADAQRLAQRLAGDECDLAACAAEIDALFARLLEFAPVLAYAGGLERSADEVPRLEGELAWARASLAEATTYNEDLAAAVERKDHDARTYLDDLVSTIARKDRELTAAHALIDGMRERVLGRMLLRGIERRKRDG